MDYYLGEIRVFPFNTVPRGWAACNGQIMSVNQNQALFALLGTQFGGNGTSTFALPNLQCASMLGAGAGSGLNTTVGQVGGSNSATVSVQQIPMHTHSFQAVEAAGSVAIGSASSYLAEPAINGPNPPTKVPVKAFIPQAGTVVALGPDSVTYNGSSQPHENRMPYLALNVCICISGIFPSRN